MIVVNDYLSGGERRLPRGGKEDRQHISNRVGRSLARAPELAPQGVDAEAVSGGVLLDAEPDRVGVRVHGRGRYPFSDDRRRDISCHARPERWVFERRFQEGDGGGGWLSVAHLR